MADVGVVVGSALTLAGSLATIALGVFVWRVAPGRDANRAFGVLAALYGTTRLIPGLAPLLADGRANVAGTFLFVIMALTGPLVGAMVWFASVHPHRRGLATRPWGLACVLVASYAAGLLVLAGVPSSGIDGSRLYGPLVLVPPLTAVFSLGIAMAFARDAARGVEGVTSLLSVAFAVYPAAIAAGLVAERLPRGEAIFAPGLFAVGIAVLVLQLARPTVPQGRRAAAAVVAFAGAAGLAAWVEAVGLVPPARLTDPVVGLSRFMLPLLVAYALVRHRLFGIDLKLKWTLRQSTIATAFVGVFFVVSESAAAFFGDRSGSVYLGIVAAGALAFALAPLQRAAERLADAAMPGVVDPRALAASAGKEEAYRAALRMALQDGTITRYEERALAKLAHELGVAYPRALELREEVEARLGLGIA